MLIRNLFRSQPFMLHGTVIKYVISVSNCCLSLRTDWTKVRKISWNLKNFVALLFIISKHYLSFCCFPSWKQWAQQWAELHGGQMIQQLQLLIFVFLNNTHVNGCSCHLEGSTGVGCWGGAGVVLAGALASASVESIGRCWVTWKVADGARWSWLCRLKIWLAFNTNCGLFLYNKQQPAMLAVRQITEQPGNTG